MTIDALHPALLLMCGALLIPILKGRLKAAWLLLLPAAALFLVARLPEGLHWSGHFLGYEVVGARVDRLSLVFAGIFCVALWLGMLFALGLNDDIQHVAALFYAGGAVGVALAGDLLTLYIFWELMAVSSTFLILARRTRAARAAALRYILVHVFGGLCLLAGIVYTVVQSGSTTLTALALEGLPAWLIFIGIAVNAAIFPLHAWLKDAYPAATPTGTVFLSAFTTKSAVYLMARMFPGAAPLVVLGAVMAVVPIVYAALEDDIRRIIAYSLINQGGFMICGIGIWTPLAVNGAVAHAVCCVIYTALLFMATGAVMVQTGRSRCSELGGLARTMPLTALCAAVGAGAIAALPLGCGFVSKSMVIAAAGHEHRAVVWGVLELASAGAVFHAGLKLPLLTFFGGRGSAEVAGAADPPLNMRLAMGTCAVLCILIGVAPAGLYRLLPYPVAYVPYTVAHVAGQLQLVGFAALAFFIWHRTGRYPVADGRCYLDTDWFYMRGAAGFYRLMDQSLNGLNTLCDRLVAKRLAGVAGALGRELPQKLALLLLLPFWLSMSSLRRHLVERQKNLYDSFRSGTVPLGISAAAAAAFLALLLGLV